MHNFRNRTNMNILIDCTNLKVGGGVQVATSFINDLYDLDMFENQLISHYKFYIALSTQMKNSFGGKKFSERFIFLNKRNYLSKIETSKYLKDVEKREKIDKTFCVFGPSYYKSKTPKIVGYAIPHFIYKDSPYITSLSLRKKIQLILMQIIKIKLFEKNSDHLIFETEDVKIKFCELYNFKIENTSVVSNTLNSIFLKKNDWSNKKFNLSNDFNILALSANYPHKNLAIIPEIIDILIKKRISCDFKFILSVTKKDLPLPEKYHKYIDFIGFIPLTDLPNLYSSVDLLFMPTLLECFSTTYLEAMFMEVPILASDMSFAKDVCGEAAHYYKSTSAKSAADALEFLIENSTARSELIHNGIQKISSYGTSMDRTKRYIQLIEEL